MKQLSFEFDKQYNRYIKDEEVNCENLLEEAGRYSKWFDDSLSVSDILYMAANGDIDKSELANTFINVRLKQIAFLLGV